jgi:glycosyltransferase involved in cell wall biosynthesis
VRALCAIDGVSEVVVVDDGSKDATAARALEAGGSVLRRDRSAGKGRAIEEALDRCPNADVWLFADGDLGPSAAGLGAVLAPVLAGEADLAVAAFPAGRRYGGFGLVKRAAGRVIRRLSGFESSEPLSGQRAISAKALEAVRPLARGFGMEVAMTIDAARAGLRVIEVPAELTHRATHRDVRGFAHRGRQGWDILRAVIPRLMASR